MINHILKKIILRLKFFTRLSEFRYKLLPISSIIAVFLLN